MIMNKTEQEFKAKFFTLLREYNVEMKVEEETSYCTGYQSMATGVNFFAYEQYDENHDPMGKSINITIGRWENGQE
jgi:hypothetical protein